MSLSIELIRAVEWISESGNLKEQVISHQEIECPLEFSVRRSLATCGVTPLEAVNFEQTRLVLISLSFPRRPLNFIFFFSIWFLYLLHPPFNNVWILPRLRPLLRCFGMYLFSGVTGDLVSPRSNDWLPSPLFILIFTTGMHKRNCIYLWVIIHL